MQPDTAIRYAWLGLVDQPTEIPAEDPRSIEGLLDRYGSTAGIAEAAGFGTAAEARARGPEAVKARENIMRDLRRYRQGTRSPSPEIRRLFDIQPSEPRPRGLREVVEFARRWGFTFVGSATVYISEDEVEREWPDPGWWVSPAVFRAIEGLEEAILARAWEDAAALTSEALSTAYLGGPGMQLAEVDDLAFVLGRSEGAQAREVGNMRELIERGEVPHQ